MQNAPTAVWMHTVRVIEGTVCVEGGGGETGGGVYNGEQMTTSEEIFPRKLRIR